ncbi:MAG: DNA mismatch repair endonuclease MutL [Bacteroidota bacterium]|nr:DNA mismatch repair endonuclease MutL [Bacteroidota bacterium]
MERKILILPESLASKIAAGEVVQRPASVVKELLENSIDADAKKITVVIKDGGKTFIQVKDDGSGMNEDDAVTSFQRHATSKISTYDDLENIRTLGFRGEALASIAAVSQVELITCTQETDVATKIRIEGVEIKEITKEAFERGTSITVKNLFFNTPGRRNFLKNNTTEFKHVFDVVVRAALSHPEVGVNFISGEETVFNLKPADISDRIRDIFGEKLSDSLIDVKSQSPFIHIKGFVSKPDFSRKTRVEQFFFLNNRYIVSRNLNYAVYQAFEYLLEKGSYPFFIIYIEIDPHKVDVNVHPSKMEVKFEDERSIYHAINSAVRDALFQENRSGVEQHPQITGDEKQRPIISHDFQLTPNEQRYFQLHSRYIIFPVDEGVMIIDQHAAHERILYERAIINFENSNTKSQHLLFPHTVELTTGEISIVESLIPELDALGFQIKIFGKNTVIVEGVPPDIKPGQEATILQEIVDLYKENENNLKLEPRDNLAKSFACKAAIKFGDPINQSEISALVEQLFSTKMPYVCPHGRPVVVKLSLSELGKRFGRI